MNKTADKNSIDKIPIHLSDKKRNSLLYQMLNKMTKLSLALKPANRCQHIGCRMMRNDLKKIPLWKNF